MIRLLCLLLIFTSAPLFASESTDADPFEEWNRVIFSFNQKADQYVLKPVAKGYQAVTPAPVRKSVSNFLNNLGEPITMINSVFQAKPGKAVRSMTRFVFNTTFGIFGIFDVAGAM